MDKSEAIFYDFFIQMGLSETFASFLHVITSLVCVLLAAFFISKILRIVLAKVFQKAFSRAETQFDDYFIENRVFFNLTNLIMLFIVKAFIPVVFNHFPRFIDGTTTFIDILILIGILWTIRSFFKTMNMYLKTLDSFKNKPVDSYVQVIMIFLWLIVFILIFSLITGETPWKFLTAMGAVSAIILLIFKDTILGFVASIQISVNDTVRIGDWVTMEKFNADGFVTEINLNTVLITNWDNTITSVPTYYLNSEPFTNWRGMEESGGRRIKRSILIKSSSVRFLTLNEIEELSKINLLTDYLKDWQQNVGQKSSGNPDEKSFLVNNRNLTNIGVFRKYIHLYLHQRADLRKDLLLLCRQLPSTPKGIPLEIYAFSNEISFIKIEPVKGDIFDHLFAIVSHFHLETFELPSSGMFIGNEATNQNEPTA